MKEEEKVLKKVVLEEGEEDAAGPSAVKEEEKVPARASAKGKGKEPKSSGVDEEDGGTAKPKAPGRRGSSRLRRAPGYGGSKKK